MVFERDVEGHAALPVDEASLDTPNCIACLHRMEVDETVTGVPFWSCPSCGATRVA